MTKIQTLKERVAKAQERVEKRKATIARHKKQLEKLENNLIKEGYTKEQIDNNLNEIKWSASGERSPHYALAVEVEWKREDLESAKKKLADDERILQNWIAKLEKAQAQENQIQNEVPQVLKDFLEEWKEKAFQWHVKRYEDFLKYCKELDAEVKKAEKELGVREGRLPNREQMKELRNRGLDWSAIEDKKAKFAGQNVLHMATIKTEKARLKWLEQRLEREKQDKLLDLQNRISDVVGEIVDATALSIKVGNLNGIVVGTKGKAKVETIGAGGWNIQCFHYRTLVHKMK